MFKAIVYDLDGTLLDSKLDFPAIKRDLGIPEEELILEYLDSLPSHVRTEKLQRLLEIELKAAEEASLFQGVGELLDTLNKKGIKQGIFTRNHRSVANFIIKKYKLPIEKLLARDHAPAKPNPLGLYMFADTWQVQPSDLVFVGDSWIDFECGRNAQVKTIHFDPDSNSRSQGADYYISDLLDILGLF